MAVQVAVVVAVAALVLAPWVIRNYETFNPRVILSTNDGKTLAGANCRSTYQGPLIGYWDYSCLGHDALANSDEAEYDAVMRAEGTAYLAFSPRAAPAGGRGPGPAGLGPLRPPAAGTAGRPADPQHRLAADARGPNPSSCCSWRSRAWCVFGEIDWRLVLVAGPVVISTIVVASTFGNPRYVVAATPSLCVGAALDRDRGVGPPRSPARASGARGRRGYLDDAGGTHTAAGRRAAEQPAPAPR